MLCFVNLLLSAFTRGFALTHTLSFPHLHVILNPSILGIISTILLRFLEPAFFVFHPELAGLTRSISASYFLSDSTMKQM